MIWMNRYCVRMRLGNDTQPSQVQKLRPEIDFNRFQGYCFYNWLKSLKLNKCSMARAFVLWLIWISLPPKKRKPDIMDGNEALQDILGIGSIYWKCYKAISQVSLDLQRFFQTFSKCYYTLTDSKGDRAEKYISSYTNIHHYTPYFMPSYRTKSEDKYFVAAK